MNTKINKIATSIVISTLVSMPITANADTKVNTAISITKNGLVTAGNIFAHSVHSVPSTLNVGSSYTAILGVVGSIAKKLTSIAVNKANMSRCMSTKYSYDDSQNVCESAPDFKKFKFCVVNMDNVNGSPVRMELVDWDINGTLGNVFSVSDVENEEQLCIDRPLNGTFLEIYNSSDKKILSRPLPMDLFNGEYGGLVKNGKFYLKEKTNKFHEIMGYHLCPDIMYNTPGRYSDDTLARRCLAKIKEKNIHNDHGQYEKLFTQTMKSSNFSSLSRSLPGIFDDEYILKNSGIDMNTNENYASIGGLFVLTNDTYAYVNPKGNGAQKISQTEIKVWNDFNYTGHTVSTDNVIYMGNRIPRSLLLKKIQESNGL
ncbi:hypothetical protein [Aliivibrio salmonicida]|uniref:hypothetical protein n=1 Tax=Aliivibrio salmonicida TaxID=40269 RepID=UPI003D0BDE27